MKHTFESSSSIASCSHDAETNTLSITFMSGDTHHYHDCDKETFEALKDAESAGKHFHKFILGKFKESK